MLSFIHYGQDSNLWCRVIMSVQIQCNLDRIVYPAFLRYLDRSPLDDKIQIKGLKGNIFMSSVSIRQWIAVNTGSDHHLFLTLHFGRPDIICTALDVINTFEVV
uniref:Putative ovule protein n=1 Tax=Solanum chacoense TaxID=4108 RepID=A0A0V0H527_SOLCH